MDALCMGAVMTKTSHTSDSQSNMRATHLQLTGKERPSCIWLVETQTPLYKSNNTTPIIIKRINSISLQ